MSLLHLLRPSFRLASSMQCHEEAQSRLWLCRRYADEVKEDKSLQPPYPMPVEWEYKTIAAPAGIQQGKINVHLVRFTFCSHSLLGFH